jgi:membrane fusion protein, multidrug efflux system
MKASRVHPLIVLLMSLTLPACNESNEKPHDEARKVTVTTLRSSAVNITRRYVCVLRSHHHIEVRAPAKGYLGALPIREGQAVKRDDLLFQVRPYLDKENSENATKVKAASIKAPFDGVVGRLPRRQGTLVQMSDTLTTLSDNSLMLAEFNVPEAAYLEYKAANRDQHNADLKIELVLANGNKFDQPGKLGAIGADFKAGTVGFRADFSNPERLLRHGQTGTVLISQVQNDAIVIPQRATFEAHDKRYVYVVDKDGVAHQREIDIQNELEDLFVVKTGVGVDDKIVIEGVSLVRDGEKVAAVPLTRSAP